MADDDVPLAALARSAPTKEKKRDEGASLASLAKVKLKKSADDNTPLTALAKAGTPQKRASGAGKPKAKAGPRRSRSSSSSSSSYYSSTSSEGAKKKKKPKAAPKRTGAPRAAKAAAAKRRLSTDTLEGDDAENKVKKKVRTDKEQVIADLLSRWWFAKPYFEEDWPPEDPNFYLKEMDKRNLRLVSCEEWEWVPEQDDKGRRKVYALSTFKGCYRNSDGDLVDLRPKDTCPCYNNFMKKSLADLCHMLISAYEKQLTILPEASKYNEEQLMNTLKSALTKVRVIQQRA